MVLNAHILVSVARIYQQNRQVFIEPIVEIV